MELTTKSGLGENEVQGFAQNDKPCTFVFCQHLLIK
jgi:hypothetical protein